jgi:hypothetical protein
MPSPSTLALLFLVLALPSIRAVAQAGIDFTSATIAAVPSAGCPVSFSVQRKSYSAVEPRRQFAGAPGAVADADAELNRATLQRQQDLASLTDLEQKGAGAAEVAQAKQRVQADDSDIQIIQQRIDRSVLKARIAQGVQLTFSPSDASRISKAAVTVHGTASRVQTISAASDAPKDSWTESFVLERSDGASALSPRALRTKGLAVSNWIEITQIDFADGTLWKGRPDAGCVLVAQD